MLSALSVILPIFALIFAGFAARKFDALGQNAVRELNRFVVYLALPALLFDVMAHANWTSLNQPGFVASFGLACGLIFYATLALRILAKRSLADASLDGISAAYANTAYIGFPLCLLVLGQQSLVLVTIASIITVCVLFASAIVVVEIGSQKETQAARLAIKVLISLAKNPLIIAPILGALYGWVGFGIAAPVETFLRLLGGAASPCALVALGLFLAEARTSNGSEQLSSLALTGTKLVLHPAITWLLAAKIFRLEQAAVDAAVLLAALPTGTGPFMLAELYRREAGISSKVILYSTLGALVTLPIYLTWGRS